VAKVGHLNLSSWRKWETFSEPWRSYRSKLTILGDSSYIPETKVKKTGKYTWIMLCVVEYLQLRSF